MRPIPLDEDIDLGHPSEVTREDLATTAQSAADSIAWRIAGIAAETKTVPTVANLKYTEMVDKAIDTARDRMFSRLVDDARQWVHSLPWGSAEWHAAILQSRMILDCRDAFAGAASRRITDVLNASTETEETTISQDSPAPQTNPERSTPKPQPQSPQAAQGRQSPPPSPINNPPAGWYKDTDNPSQQRWWDGETWTQHTQATTGGLSNTIDAAAGKSGAVGPSNPAAATGFGLGVAAFFLFNIPIFGLLLSLAAVLVSYIGLSKQSSAMAMKFRAFGIVGLILGIVYTLRALLALNAAR